MVWGVVWFVPEEKNFSGSTVQEEGGVASAVKMAAEAVDNRAFSDFCGVESGDQASGVDTPDAFGTF